MRPLAYLSAACVLLLASCVESTMTAPDGTVTKLKQPAPGVLPFLGAAVIAYSPRPIVVKEEKSIRGSKSRESERQAAFSFTSERRISKEEINDRWKPLYGPKLPSNDKQVISKKAPIK